MHSYTYRLTHPLGEHVLQQGRQLQTPTATLAFDLTHHDARILMLEQLQSRSGWLELNLLQLDSFQQEEHLVFTALTDKGELLDQEACERLFNLAATASSCETTTPQALNEQVRRQLDATLAKALNENNEYFQRERDKLEAWAEDQLHSAEQQLLDTKDRLRDAKRRARTAETPDAQKKIMEEIKDLEQRQRRQRQSIFDVEDAIEARRDSLIAALERRLHQKSSVVQLFRVRWELH